MIGAHIAIGGILGTGGGGSIVIPVATTTQLGIVELANSGEVAPSVVIQGNDGRVPTADEKSALVGTGLPSVTNPYVTQDSIQILDGGTF